MMDECKWCANADNEYCFACDNGNQFKPMTNADRIRSMSDEELASILVMQGVVLPPWCTENYDCPCADQDPVRCDLCALNWLQQEAPNEKKRSDIYE